jgi:hypothetical protein
MYVTKRSTGHEWGEASPARVSMSRSALRRYTLGLPQGATPATGRHILPRYYLSSSFTSPCHSSAISIWVDFQISCMAVTHVEVGCSGPTRGARTSEEKSLVVEILKYLLRVYYTLEIVFQS